MDIHLTGKFFGEGDAAHNEPLPLSPRDVILAEKQKTSQTHYLGCRTSSFRQGSHCFRRKNGSGA